MNWPRSSLLLIAALVVVSPSNTNSYARSQSASTKAASSILLTVTPRRPGREFALGAVGLSIEAQELTTPDLTPDHASLVSLLQQLGRGVLRVGGGSLEYSWWTSDNEPAPRWATGVVTPADLAKLGDLLRATGWRVILGIDFGHFDPPRAADEAGIAKRILGSSLLGFEIGNEPNGYGLPRVALRTESYSPSNYLDQLRKYTAAIQSAAPGTSLYGPEVSSPEWLQAIASSEMPPFATVTLHYYPTSYSVSNGVCKGTPVPTALDLLSKQVRDEENLILQDLAKAGEDAHRATRISETNSTGSCDVSGGPATSPVFASALWALDWTLRSVSAGVSGLNFHGYFGECAPYSVSPICARGYAAELRGQVMARPEYYGLLAARQLEGGRLLPVSVSVRRGDEDLTAYATKQPGGQITVALDNFSTDQAAAITLRAHGYRRGLVEFLRASSIDARGSVTFGHASASVSGILQPTGTVIRRHDGLFQFMLPPASAGILRLQL